MTKKRIKRQQQILMPQNSILFVCTEGIKEIPSDSIRLEQVGEKAFGLSSLPKFWTIPFCVVSEELLSLYTKCPKKKRNQLLKFWIDQITIAALRIKIGHDNSIIVRSSGCSEGLVERGQYYSKKGTLRNILQPLAECLRELASDNDLCNQKIPLVIQKFADPISAKGHLSNERRCYEESRDWLGEYEERKGIKTGNPFKINLRYWRKRILVSNLTKEPLKCNLSIQISEVLKIPAAWAYDQGLRLHFEWVWDGKVIYLVQADKEHKTRGVDPTKIPQVRLTTTGEFTPKCLKQINKSIAYRYNKIRNVYTYMKLGLPTIKLYILDDQSVMKDLAKGKVSTALKADLHELVKGSLVIRMDIAADGGNRYQLLPRTDEVRDVDSALTWIKEKSIELKKLKKKDTLAFIFHNFVPAVSSAFAFAAPGKRKVQIEALWGLPEGLYYNSHDKYIVDTLTTKREELHSNNIDRFEVKAKRNFKNFFISPDTNGRWTIKILKEPYDWRSSIPRLSWVKEIAMESRRIVEEEGKPLSIMWFIGLSSAICGSQILPWFHEFYDLKIDNRTLTHRTKTPFDKSLVIRTNKDIEVLQRESEKQSSSLRRIKIQPSEEALIRNKDTLYKIGDLAQKIGAIILLEGGVLSHAYYQLRQTKAIVEVINPFDYLEDKREFNKLVRDKVPSNIEYGGEIVSKTHLSGEFLLSALCEKLVEESYEVMDAADQDKIVGELADLSEIIDTILSKLGLSRDELWKRQDKKRKKAGGFKRGLVLLETRNLLPIEKSPGSGEGLFDDFKTISQESVPIKAQKIIELGHKIDKWRDRREHPTATEIILHLVIPIVRNTWNSAIPEMKIESNSDHFLKAKLKGIRKGSKLEIELSIFLHKKQGKQLKLYKSID